MDIKKVPLSWGIKTHDLVYISGMPGFDMKNKKMVPGGIKAQTTQALQNIAVVAEAGGTSMDKLLSCSVSMANITRDFKDMNDAYKAFFPKDPPSRTAIQIAKLAGDPKDPSLVEIQCVAASQASDRSVVPGPPHFPLSAAIASSNIVFASGVQGRDGMKIVPGGIANQTTVALQSLETTLAKAGSDAGHVVSCTVYISDINQFADMNAAYKTFWQGQQKSALGGFPSRICSESSGIAGGADVEITCIAVSNKTTPKIITVPGWKKLDGFPLSIATSAAGMVFASGLQGWNTTTMTVVPGGIAAETTQALKNMGEVFTAAGANFTAGALECEVSLRDLADFAEMNAAYSAFWDADHPPPARISVQVAGLAGTAKVEIKCTGVLSTDVKGQDEILGLKLPLDEIII